MMDYTPENLEQRLAEAGRALATELEADTAVAQAKANYEKAQQQLEQAQASKLPWPGNTSKHRLSEWHKSVAAEQAAKVQVSEAEREFRSAQNDAASARYSRRMQAERDQQREKREADQARHSMIEQETARGMAEARWFLAGGTAESFAAAWPSLWRAELTRRTQAAEEQSNRQIAARVRGAF